MYIKRWQELSSHASDSGEAVLKTQQWAKSVSMLTCSQWQHDFYVHHPSLACKLKFGKQNVQLRLMGIYLQIRSSTNVLDKSKITPDDGATCLED